MFKPKLSYIKIVKINIFLSIIFLTSIIYSQEFGSLPELNEELKGKTFKELFIDFKKIKNDSLKIIYSNYYLNEARKENDTANIVRGFYMVSQLEEKNYLNILDSIIVYSKNLNHHYYPWVAYRGKGTYYFKNRDFKKSLDNHIIALNLAKEHQKKKQEITTKISIGLLKERIGKHQEALKIFKECYQYKSKKFGSKPFDSLTKVQGRNYLNLMNLLANSYRKNGFSDSATFINRRFNRYSKFDRAKKQIAISRLSQAEIHLERKEFSAAIDSCNKALSELIIFKDTKNLAVSYYVLGMAKNGLSITEESINDLKKMDSIFGVLNDLSPDLRKGFKLLINNAKRKKDYKNQLYYVERLLKFDSIIHNNYAYISEGFVNKVEKPNLIKTQKILQKKLLKSKNQFSSSIQILFLVILISIVVFVIIKRRHITEKKRLENKYKEKFDNLLKDQNQTKLDSKPKTEINKSEKNDIGIPSDIVEKILKKLEQFESQNRFTDPDINATNLAKKFGTNPNYLGKIIKFHKGKTFRSYLSDLRIELSLYYLRNDPTFRNYSILGIANEVGFKNAEPFSKAFHSKIGIYPSEFVSKLKEM